MNLKKGFTIIELIVVVAVIVVLAAIVITSVTVYINKSKDAKVKADVTTLVKDALAYSTNPVGTEFPGFDATDCPNGCLISIRPSPCPWHNVSSNNLYYFFYHDGTNFMAAGGLCVKRNGVNAYFCRDSSGAVGTFTGWAGAFVTCSTQIGWVAGGQ